MRHLAAFLGFWYGLLIGDDWLVAVGLVVVLASTALLVRNESLAWLWLPLAVGLLLAAALWRAGRSAGPPH